MRGAYDSMLLNEFILHAKDNPQKIAVVDNDGNRNTTYIELAKEAASYAKYLENSGVKKGQVITIELGRQAEHYAVMLACFSLGIVFVAVSDYLPPDRKEILYKVCNPVLKFNRDILKDVEIIDEPFKIDQSLTEKDEGYIIFTSGSTGEPKAVLHDRSVFELMEGARRQVYKPGYTKFGLNFDDVNVQHAALADFSFILSMTDFMFILFGKAVHIVSAQTLHDGIALKKYLFIHKIQGINILPSALHRLLPLPDLKISLVAGEPCLFDFKNCGVLVVNAYGSSESTLVSYGDAADGNAIGKFIDGSKLWLSKEDNEICYQGPGIMIKYLNDDELTAKALETDKDGNKVLHTRDIGRRLEDGKIEILGRIDSIVKIRGMRVSTDEVSQKICAISNIKEAAVKAFEHGNENILCAYYTTKDGGELNQEDIVEELKKSLNPYMIPSVFKYLNEFPRNDHGKIDFKKLPDLMENKEKINIVENENDDVTSFVLSQFNNILSLNNTSPDDDFISLGGSSLKSMQLQFSIKEKYGISLSSAELMELSTPSNISEAIKEGLNKKGNDDLAKVKYSFDDVVPLSNAQMNVYLDEKMHTNSTRYNLPMCIKFKNYSFDQVDKALKEVIKKHPALKARIIETDDGAKLKFDAGISIEYDDNDTFVRAFNIFEKLVRFRILNTDEGIKLYSDLHHLICDGTTYNILANELFENVKELSSSNNNNDDGLLRQISFEQSLKNSIKEEEASKFYDSMLSECDEINTLIPSINGKNGRIRHNIKINQKEFNSFLKKNKITTNQFLNSAFGYTVSRFTGDDKALLCLIEDGRGQIDLRESIGMYVKTLPLVINCQYENTCDFLKESCNRVRKAMANDFYPLKSIVDKYKVITNIQFQYAHNLFNINNDDISFETLGHDVIAPFAVSVENDKDGFSVLIRHDDNYSDEFANSFANAFDKILHGLMYCEKLSEIDYTSKEDLLEINKTNKTEITLPYSDIISAFNKHCDLKPDASLVRYDNFECTYGKGRRIINAISSELKKYIENEKSYIAVFVKRSHWYLLGALAVLNTGNAYVPIEEEHPDERISYMLKDTDASVILVDNETIGRAKKLSNNATLINLDNIYNNLKEFKNNYKFAKNIMKYEPNDIGCVIYTSGTTGNPKGALLTRIGMLNVCYWHVTYCKLNSKSVYGMYPSYSFVSHIEPLLSPTIVGGCVDIIPSYVRLDLPKLVKYISEHNITNIKMGASIGRNFVLEHGLTSLKTLMLGGEKLGEITNSNSYEVIDAYGPSEYTAQASAAKVKEKICDESVGGPIFNTKLYVLDSNLRIVPVGAVGQLAYSGLGNAKGYLNRIEETKKAFVRNPFDIGEKGYEQLYLSGDMARVLPDGTIGIIGRKDSQVKINGNRVEVGEVTSCIRSLDFIKEAAVLPYKKNNKDTSLIAYVVLKDNHDSKLDDENVLRDYICGKVTQDKPVYMVPSFVIRLDKMPLNSNNKLDKKALPIPEEKQVKKNYIAPNSELEKEVVKAFEDVFGFDHIGIDDDFLIMGGNSLKAIQLSSILRKYDLHALDIPLLKTPRRISEYLKEKSENPENAEIGNKKDMYYSFTNKGEKKLVFVHEAFGSPVIYQAFVPYLDSRISFGGLENYNLIHYDHPIEDFYESADEKIRELKAVQPNGPYNLGGWSYGGSMAYEMAYRLEQMGDKVENVFLLDSYFAKERPIVGIWEKVDKIFPDFITDYIVQHVLKPGNNIKYDIKTAHRFKNSLLYSDRQLKQAVTRDLKAHVVYFSAISNRKPTVKFLNIPKDDKKTGFDLLNFGDIKLSNTIDLNAKMSKSQEIIQVNTNHLNMVSDSSAKVIADYINQVMFKNI